MIKNKIVEIEKREIYIYGLEVILLNGGLLITFLIISLLCGEMINFAAYLIFFLPVRLFSGGYHAETSERCFILSTIMFGISIAASKLVPLLYTFNTGKIIGAVSVLVILVLAPLINENNPLNEMQRKRNRIILCTLLIFDLVFFILSRNCDWTIASNELIFIITDAVLLAAGKLKQSICTEKKTHNR
ncbi:MAG: accessory gene regulator B family protein [Ruminococcus flavefaciens]|nr:accessory gene regulator B family protein [Ruminococcus flavefaciens]